jgi:p-cumate 2,3-dioxygenase ferredoxin reductase subunit
VTLRDGREIAADLVLVGIGVESVPTVADRLWAAVGCGASRSTPTAVPRRPACFAQATRRCNGAAATAAPIRVETWANAQNQAISVAANMIGQGKRI